MMSCCSRLVWQQKSIMDFNEPSYLAVHVETYKIKLQSMMTPQHFFQIRRITFESH